MSVKVILDSLRASGQKLIFAESLTGGLLADAFIQVAGASEVVLGSEVVYSEALKVALLGVDEGVLNSKGAVSAEVAKQMAIGVSAVGQAATDLSKNQILAIATTGNAGPSTSGSAPVGKVFIALAIGEKVKLQEFEFEGGRQSIRNQSVHAAIAMLREHLSL